MKNAFIDYTNPMMVNENYGVVMRSVTADIQKHIQTCLRNDKLMTQDNRQQIVRLYKQYSSIDVADFSQIVLPSYQKKGTEIDRDFFILAHLSSYYESMKKIKGNQYQVIPETIDQTFFSALGNYVDFRGSHDSPSVLSSCLPYIMFSFLANDASRILLDIVSEKESDALEAEASLEKGRRNRSALLRKVERFSKKSIYRRKAPYRVPSTETPYCQFAESANKAVISSSQRILQFFSILRSHFNDSTVNITLCVLLFDFYTDDAWLILSREIMKATYTEISSHFASTSIEAGCQWIKKDPYRKKFSNLIGYFFYSPIFQLKHTIHYVLRRKSLPDRIYLTCAHSMHDQIRYEPWSPNDTYWSWGLAVMSRLQEDQQIQLISDYCQELMGLVLSEHSVFGDHLTAEYLCELEDRLEYPKWLACIFIYETIKVCAITDDIYELWSHRTLRQNRRNKYYYNKMLLAMKKQHNVFETIDKYYVPYLSTKFLMMGTTKVIEVLCIEIIKPLLVFLDSFNPYPFRKRRNNVNREYLFSAPADSVLQGGTMIGFPQDSLVSELGFLLSNPDDFHKRTHKKQLMELAKEINKARKVDPARKNGQRKLLAHNLFSSVRFYYYNFIRRRE